MEGSDGSPATTSQEQQHHACAACKHQRKKCEPSCVFRPYFPSENHDQFMKVHKVFGVSNMHKMIKTIQEGPPDDWQKAVESLVWEAELRHQDPMLGSWGENERLWKEVKALKRQNEFLWQMCKSLKHGCSCNYQQRGNSVFSNNAGYQQDGNNDFSSNAPYQQDGNNGFSNNAPNQQDGNNGFSNNARYQQDGNNGFSNNARYQQDGINGFSSNAPYQQDGNNGFSNNARYQQDGSNGFSSNARYQQDGNNVLSNNAGYQQDGNNGFSNNALIPAYEPFVPEPLAYAGCGAPTLHDQALVDPVNGYNQYQLSLPVTGQLQQDFTSTNLRGHSNSPYGSMNGQF